MENEKIEIKGLNEGSYVPMGKYLVFKTEKGNELIIDYKSAAEITWSLFDGLNMLDKDMEELMNNVFEKIEK